MTLTSSTTVTGTPLQDGTPTALDPVRWPELAELSTDVSQQIFRTCLNALSRPGRIGRLPADVLPAGVPQVISPLLALTDLMTSIAGLPSTSGNTCAEQATQRIAGVTGARTVAADQARFALAFEASDDLALLPVGTSWSPEFGATVCRRVAALSEDSRSERDHLLRITGPGVDGLRRLAVSGVEEEFWQARATLTAGYPTGIDLLLITDDGDIAGLPRTTQITRTTRIEVS